MIANALEIWYNKRDIIAMASEVLMSISKDEVERARLMSEYKYQRSQRL
jgi:hypothetical protein